MVSHSMMKLLARNKNTNKSHVLNTFHNFYKLFVLRGGSQMKYAWIYSPHKTGLYNKIRKKPPSKENELFINTLRDLFRTRGGLKIHMEHNFSVPCPEIMGNHQ